MKKSGQATISRDVEPNRLKIKASGTAYPSSAVLVGEEHIKGKHPSSVYGCKSLVQGTAMIGLLGSFTPAEARPKATCPRKLVGSLPWSPVKEATAMRHK